MYVHQMHGGCPESSVNKSVLHVDHCVIVVVVIIVVVVWFNAIAWLCFNLLIQTETFTYMYISLLFTYKMYLKKTNNDIAQN